MGKDRLLAEFTSTFSPTLYTHRWTSAYMGIMYIVRTYVVQRCTEHLYHIIIYWFIIICYYYIVIIIIII